MLLTFSRRAAQEMTRRVGRRAATGDGIAGNEARPTSRGAGTFHSIGARLLREYAGHIGLRKRSPPGPGDAEDLMGMVRHEIGLTETGKRFPLKGTCLAIYSRVVNTRDPHR